MKTKKPQNEKSFLKAKVKKAHFLDVVSQAYSLVEKRSIIAILSKVLIQAKDRVLHIHATDQDNALQADIPATVESPGKVVVDSQHLFDILKELDDGEIDLSEQKDKKFRMKQKASVFHLLGVDSHEFPIFPPFKMQNSFFINSKILKSLLDKSSYCASTDETRYHLNSVFFETLSQDSKNFFRFVATDTHRLALSEHVCKKNFLKQGVIIPRKGVSEIKKLLASDVESDIECSLEIPRILFRYKQTVLSIKLVEGSYPNYQKLIPKKSTLSIAVKTSAFYQSLKRASILSPLRFKAVTLEIKGKKACMKAEDANQGFAQDEVTLEDKQGEDLTIRFNASYLMEAINSLEEDKIVLEFNGNKAACLIRGFEKKPQEKCLSIIMPMAL